MDNLSVLKEYWKSIDGKKDVLVFYSSVQLKENSPPYNFFSNFWIHKDPYNFTIPEWCGTFKNKKVQITFAEKAIMLCKASLMDNKEAFYKILDCKTPFGCKKLGRSIKPFNEKLWIDNVMNIAKEIVFAKFNSNIELKQKLIDTGDKIIAEAAEHDMLWGIGMSCQNMNNQFPNRWNGSNILGWALMEVRKNLCDN